MNRATQRARDQRLRAAEARAASDAAIERTVGRTPSPEEDAEIYRLSIAASCADIASHVATVIADGVISRAASRPNGGVR